MKIVFLGTTAMVPTRERNHSSIYLEYKGEGILIDAGEGTQRQLRIKGIPVTKVKKILITHWHGDHVLGLLGIIQSLGANHYTETLNIFGPKGSKEYLNHLLKGVSIRHLINLNVEEISKGIFFKNENYKLEAFPLKHSASCLAYKFIENDKRNINLDYTKKFGLEKDPILGKLQKGKDIVYDGHKISVKQGTILKKGKVISFVIDTKYFKEINKFVKDSDYLISEGTLLEEHKNPEHLTAKEAAKMAKDSKVKNLILTHFSQRYKSVDELEKEAKAVFKNTKLAYDFMEIII